MVHYCKECCADDINCSEYHGNQCKSSELFVHLEKRGDCKPRDVLQQHNHGKQCATQEAEKIIEVREADIQKVVSDAVALAKKIAKLDEDICNVER